MQIIKALRPPQMLKNLLIFAPIITLGNYQTSEFITLLNIFFGFSCVVFSTYILNDLIDIESDKLHPIKKFRPVASGVMPLSNWTIISSILFLIGILWLYIIDLTALVIALIYCSVSISYSLKLKYFKFVDILSISFLFILRICIGAFPLSIPLSTYLIIFVFFSSLGIVAGKKYSILNSEKIEGLKVKKFLESSYKPEELLTIVKLSFITSLTTYIIWILFYKIKVIDYFRTSSLFLSFICLLIFKYFFYINTKKNSTEDIFNFIKSKSILFLIVLLFTTSSIYGLL